MLTINCYLHVCVSKDSLKQVSQSTERYDRPRQWLGVEIAKFNCAQNVAINYTSEPSALFRRTKNWLTSRKMYADIRAMSWQDLITYSLISFIHSLASLSGAAPLSLPPRPFFVEKNYKFTENTLPKLNSLSRDNSSQLKLADLTGKHPSLTNHFESAPFPSVAEAWAVPAVRGPCSCTQLTHSRVLLLIQWFFLSLKFVRWSILSSSVGSFASKLRNFSYFHVVIYSLVYSLLSVVHSFIDTVLSKIFVCLIWQALIYFSHVFVSVKSTCLHSPFCGGNIF